MSANLYWRQITPKKGKSLDVGAPSSFISVVRDAFGSDLPIRLERDDLPTLRGMAAMEKNSMTCNRNNPFQDLIEALEKYDAIEIWAEW